MVSYGDVGKQAVHVEAYNAQPEPSRPTEGRKIFGLAHKTFFILLAVVLVLVTAAAVGGGVIGISAARNREDTAAVSITLHHQHLKHQRQLKRDTRIQALQLCNGLISMAHCTRDSITKTTT